LKVKEKSYQSQKNPKSWKVFLISFTCKCRNSVYFAKKFQYLELFILKKQNYVLAPPSHLLFVSDIFSYCPLTEIPFKTPLCLKLRLFSLNTFNWFMEGGKKRKYYSVSSGSFLRGA